MRTYNFLHEGKDYVFTILKLPTVPLQFHIPNSPRVLTFIDQDRIIFFADGSGLRANFEGNNEFKDFVFKQLIIWSEEENFYLIPE